MIKWFAYIVLLLLLTPCLSFAKKGNIPPFSDKIELVVANNAADTASAKKPLMRFIAGFGAIIVAIDL